MWPSNGFHKADRVADGLFKVGVSVHIYGLVLIGRTLPPEYTGTMPRGRHLQRIPREERARRLGQEPLGPGEASEPVQVRAREGVLNRFKELSARERGQVVALGLVLYDRYEQPPEPEELEDVLDGIERVAEIMERIPDLIWRVIERLWGR
jgi:hypothetical protein